MFNVTNIIMITIIIILAIIIITRVITIFLLSGKMGRGFSEIK